MYNYKKLIAGIAAVAVSAGATTSIAFAVNKDTTGKETSEVSQEASGEVLTTGETPQRNDSGSPAFKDETVYVICSENSDVKQIIVSDWLKTLLPMPR